MKIRLMCYLCHREYEIEIGKSWLEMMLCPHELKEVNPDGNDR